MISSVFTSKLNCYICIIFHSLARLFLSLFMHRQMQDSINRWHLVSLSMHQKHTNDSSSGKSLRWNLKKIVEHLISLSTCRCYRFVISYQTDLVFSSHKMQIKSRIVIAHWVDYDLDLVSLSLMIVLQFYELISPLKLHNLRLRWRIRRNFLIWAKKFYYSSK